MEIPSLIHVIGACTRTSLTRALFRSRPEFSGALMDFITRNSSHRVIALGNKELGFNV